MKTMKKILSVCLALVLMAAMFAISASADTTETPVGSADSGLEDKDFNDKNSSGQNINVTVEKVSHRYAVDLTFSFNDLTIDSTITWNVKDLKYDVGTTKLNGDQTRTITVTNRSDLPVYAYAVADDKDNADGVAITTSNNADSRLMVDKATVGNGNTNGTSTSENLTVTLKSDSWQEVAGYYAAKRLDDKKDLDNSVSYVLTTVTVTISKSAN